MRLALDSFRGQAPRLTPRALPANAAQSAVNAKLVSGDLEPWRQFATTKLLTAAAAVRSIYLLNDKWLSWTQQVDVARGIIAGDTTYRTYLTCPALYGKPQWTNYALATTGAEPFPVATRPLGVPAPDTAPGVAVDVSVSTESNITLTNPGAEVGTTTGWTVSSGSLVVYDNGDIVGLNAQAGTQFFGGGVAAASLAYQDVDLEAEGVLAGQGLKLAWYQATGAAGSTAGMGIEFYDAADVLISTVDLEQLAPAAVHTWQRRQMTVPTPEGAVTARLRQIYTRVGAGPTIDAYIDAITLESVEYANYFDGSSLAGWDASPNSGTPGASGSWREVGIDPTVGWAPPVFMIRGDELTPWIHRDFSTVNSPAVKLKFDFQQTIEPGHGMHVQLFANDAGRGASVFLGTGGVSIANNSSWDDAGTYVEAIGAGLAPETQYTVTITGEQVSASQARLTVRVVRSDSTVMIDDAKANVTIDGSRIGLKGQVGGLEGKWWIDNVYVTVAAPKSRDTVESIATSYVYRFVNDLGEPSAPSLASDTVVRPDGGAVLVTTPTTAPVGTDPLYGITTKQIYRSISGASGTAFVFVAEIPLAQADYLDAFDDAEIADNEVLNSEGWDLPPDDLEGIIALPNETMAGFRKNQVCFSVSGHPHAWRVQDRKTTDTDVVAIANIDNTVVIGTKKWVYTATGNSNDSYSMSAPGAAQACLSKRGMVFLDGIGVVFPSPDGWMACAGSAGNLSNISEGIFTKKQWEALDPTSVIAAVHDGALFWFSTGQTPDSGYALDVRPSGFGLVSLSFHASAAFVDPLTDSLYLVLDAVNEPSEALLPVASSAPAPATPAKTIFKFDGATNGDLLRFAWKGKLHLMPYPAALPFGQVQALAFTNLVLRVYADGALIHTRLLANATEFPVPALKAYSSYEIELVGTSTARTAQLAEDISELA